MIIRDAEKKDCVQIADIYNYYIENTAITYECDRVDAAEIEKRMSNVQARFPYLVCLKDDLVVGYGYCRQYIDRKACQYSVEASLYVRNTYQKQGIGKLLYQHLQQRLIKMGIVNMYVSISCCERADEFVDDNSINFHRHLGFKTIGTFKSCGYKFNRWYNLCWMEKTLMRYDEIKDEVINYNLIKDEFD
ncbi:MAG: GNAT family N-acetyltransferase [Erysipelotrichaceae bacterium]